MIHQINNQMHYKLKFKDQSIKKKNSKITPPGIREAGLDVKYPIIFVFKFSTSYYLKLKINKVQNIKLSPTECATQPNSSSAWQVQVASPKYA